MTRRYYLRQSYGAYLLNNYDPVFYLRYGDVVGMHTHFCFPEGTERVYSRESLMQLLAYYFYNDDFTIEGCGTIRCESEMWRCALQLLEKIERDPSWISPRTQHWTLEDHVGAIVIEHGDTAHNSAHELRAQIEYHLQWRNDGYLLLQYRTNRGERGYMLSRIREMFSGSVSAQLHRLFKPDSPMMYEILAKIHWTETHGLVEEDHSGDRGIWVFKPRESEIHQLTVTDHHYPTRQNARRFF